MKDRALDPDLALVTGLIIFGFSIPSMMSALTDGRAPRASALTLLIAFSLLLYALVQKPNGYSLRDVPDAFANVAGRYLP
jgi:hypothetical protein